MQAALLFLEKTRLAGRWRQRCGLEPLRLATSTAREPEPCQAPDCHLACAHLRELRRRPGRIRKPRPKPFYLGFRGGEF